MDIDVSKENIQPLRGGRNLTQLGTALQAQSDLDAQRQLQIQKEEHESAINHYQGPDPLDPWFNYIQWVEQCFPKHGHEGHIDKLVKDCLQRFENDERYFQDRRLVKLWIKYIDCLSNPLEIYQRLYNCGIGVECSEFYRAWACYCEESGDYKKANQVYVLGLQAKAQPLDELEQAHMNFQLFFAQRMLHDDSPTKRKAASALAETRSALTSLKSFKRRNIANVPVQRVGDNIRSVVPGVVRQQTFDNRMPNSNVMITVYEDAPSTSHAVPEAQDPGLASLVQACSNVENEKEVGIWTNPKTKMVHSNVVPHQPLPFTPYQDEDDVLRLSAKHLPYCVDDLTFDVPLCVPDPPDPTKIPCYNKSQVYVNDKEYSLEEIRSRKYNLQRTTKTETQETVQVKRNTSNSNETMALCSALETLANCALDAEQDHLGQLMPLAIPAIQNITKVTNMHSPGEPKVLVNLDSKEVSEHSAKKHDDSQKSDKENLASNYGSENVPTNYGKNNLMEEFNRSLMSNLLGDSVTVNTKEARWELRNIFNDNEPTMAEPTMVQPVVQQFDMQQFDIHEDRSMTMAINTKKKEVDVRAVPEDKENANQFSVPVAAPPQANKTAYYEEPSCTQVFNFNIKDASTPNMSQFKKPSSYIDQSKYPSVPKFSIDESVIEQDPSKRDEVSRQMASEHATGDHQGAGLSVIMEATREYNSKSGSTSSSGQSTRTNFTGYSNFDSMYNNHDPSQPTTSKRTSMLPQPRTNNGQFARAYPQKQPERQPPSVPYLHDHQYQKPQNYNGYSPQQMHYQQNYNYQQRYSNQMVNQQGYASPAYHSPQIQGQHHAMQSPHHAGMQNAHHASLQGPHGVSPHHAVQGPHQTVQGPHQAAQSPHQAVQGPHQAVQGPHQAVQGPHQAVQSPHQAVQAPHHAGMQSPHHAGMQSPHHAGMQSPHHAGMQSPHQAGLQSPHHPGMQSPHHAGMQSPHHAGMLSPHQSVPAGFQSPTYSNQMGSQMNYHNQSHAMVSPQQAYARHYNYPSQERQHVYSQQQQPQVFQSPPHQTQYQNAQYYRPSQVATSPAPGYQQPSYHSQYNSPNPYANANHSQNMTPTQPAKAQTVDQQEPKTQQDFEHRMKQQSEDSRLKENRDQYNNPNFGNANHNVSQKGNVSQKSQPVENKKDVSRRFDFENRMEFQSEDSRDSVKDNQHNSYASINVSAQKTPQGKPSADKKDISKRQFDFAHRMEYQSEDSRDSVKDSKSNQYVYANENARHQNTSVQSKTKDISKTQLDFEHRMEFQSEDSRDSGKGSRISSVYSRQSDIQSEGYGMDVDSENSMECGGFKSTHSISLVETSDIPRPADIEFPKQIDPFNKKMLASLLEYVKFPNKTHADGYIEVRSVPKLQVGTVFGVGGNKYSVEKQLGKGNYGAVFLCLDLHTNKSVAVKYQKPSRPWEFYICQEIKARIKDPFMLPGYMDISTSFLGDNASLFVSEYSKYGSLLDVANKVKVATTKCINEFIVILLTSEMLSIVHYLHKAQIIHADIKPDNFLLMQIPAQEWRTPSLQLIDLGCAIDMSLFPEKTTFRELIATEGFTCTEMREGKPWTYQTDLYCLAGTIHVILMGSYMKVAHRLGQWNIDKKFPRYMKVSLWDKIFTTLLNVPDCNTLPDLMDLKGEVDSVLSDIDNLGPQLRNLANVLKSR